uniref:Uncharacterized protein n=1 Tax=viral metagenome TaxID=1070528 RepID=A0A6C0ECH9_9ZZZZ
MSHTLEQLRKLFEEYENDESIVYKKCKDSIVALKKLKDTITNESRKGIYNPLFAKFRADKLKVIKIVDIVTLESLKCVNNYIYDKSIEYKLNKIVEEPDFDKNLDRICAKGIHYFKTLDPAYYFSFCPLVDNNKYTGSIIKYDDNGLKKRETNWKKGKQIGKTENNMERMYFMTFIMEALLVK